MIDTVAGSNVFGSAARRGEAPPRGVPPPVALLRPSAARTLARSGPWTLADLPAGVLCDGFLRQACALVVVRWAGRRAMRLRRQCPCQYTRGRGGRGARLGTCRRRGCTGWKP